MKEINIELPKNNEFNIMVMGDMHIGDSLCDYDTIQETIDFVKNTPNTYVILNGDLINNALKSSKSDSYIETMTIEEEQDLLIELLEPIKDKILVIATGNHEYRTQVLAGINPLKAVAIALGLRDRLVDYSYLLDLSFGTAYGIKNQKNRYLIYGTHGGHGGGRRSGSTANALEDMARVRPDCDLYVHSHTHNQLSFNDIVFLYNKTTKKTKEHQRTFYNANAFLKYGGYSEQKGYRPAPRSPSLLTIKAIRKNNDMKIITNIVRI